MRCQQSPRVNSGNSRRTLLIARRFDAAPIFIPSISKRSIATDCSEVILAQLSFRATSRMTQLSCSAQAIRRPKYVLCHSVPRFHDCEFPPYLIKEPREEKSKKKPRKEKSKKKIVEPAP